MFMGIATGIDRGRQIKVNDLHEHFCSILPLTDVVVSEFLYCK